MAHKFRYNFTSHSLTLLSFAYKPVFFINYGNRKCNSTAFFLIYFCQFLLKNWWIMYVHIHLYVSKWWYNKKNVQCGVMSDVGYFFSYIWWVIYKKTRKIITCVFNILTVFDTTKKKIGRDINIISTFLKL